MPQIDTFFGPSPPPKKKKSPHFLWKAKYPNSVEMLHRLKLPFRKLTEAHHSLLLPRLGYSTPPVTYSAHIWTCE